MLKSDANTSSTNSVVGSQATLLPAANGYHGDLDVVVFGVTGSSGKHKAAVMVGLIPAIEGSEGTTAEGALKQLMTATSELLGSYIPKLGAHQRTIHGGGVFDEDMISAEIDEARKKS